MTEFEVNYLGVLNRIAEGLEGIEKSLDFYNEKLFFNEKGLLVTVQQGDQIG